MITDGERLIEIAEFLDTVDGPIRITKETAHALRDLLREYFAGTDQGQERALVALARAFDLRSDYGTDAESVKSDNRLRLCFNSDGTVHMLVVSKSSCVLEIADRDWLEFVAAIKSGKFDNPWPRIRATD